MAASDNRFLSRCSPRQPFKFDHVHIISQDPEALAKCYVEMFGATIAANTMARGAPQIFVDLGGVTILIHGQRPAIIRSLPGRSDNSSTFRAITHVGSTILA